MAALSKKRACRWKKAGGMDLPVGTNVTLYAGAFAVLSAGYLIPSGVATGLTRAGKITDTVINTGANGAVTAYVEFPKEKTLFPFLGDPDNLPTQAHVGGTVYLLDDQTVSSLATGKSAAGTLWKLETTNGVTTFWVEV